MLNFRYLKQSSICKPSHWSNIQSISNHEQLKRAHALLLRASITSLVLVMVSSFDLLSHLQLRYQHLRSNDTSSAHKSRWRVNRFQQPRCESLRSEIIRRTNWSFATDPCFRPVRSSLYRRLLIDSCNLVTPRIWTLTF